MLQALWTIFNICLFFYFMYIAFNSIKLVRGHFGRWAAIVFGFGIFAYTCGPRDTDSNRDDKKWTFNSPDSILPNTRQYMQIELSRSWINSYLLQLQYGQHKTTGKWVPIYAHSTVNGLFGATTYTPDAISLYQTNDSSLYRYEVNAGINWLLLSMPLLSQQKNYEGTVALNK